MASICFTTVPLLIILVMNIILYFLTWKRIRDETKKTRYTLGKKPANMQASHRAAKSMSLFVAAFFIQWWALALYGVWALVAIVPQVIIHLATIFSNIGGVLNLCVYVIIRRKNLTRGEILTTGGKVISSDSTKRSDTFQGSNEASADEIQLSETTTSSTSGQPESRMESSLN